MHFKKTPKRLEFCCIVTIFPQKYYLVVYKYNNAQSNLAFELIFCIC